MADDLSEMIRDDLGRFLGKFNDVKPELRAAAAARKLMIRRIRTQGLDRHDKPFEPYAESTKRIKRRKGQPSSIVTLTDSRQMLDDLVVQAPSGSGGGFTIRGGKTRRIAQITPGTARSKRLLRLHTRGAPHLPVRDAFGLTGGEQRVIDAQFRADMERGMPDDARRRVTINVIQNV